MGLVALTDLASPLSPWFLMPQAGAAPAVRASPGPRCSTPGNAEGMHGGLLKRGEVAD